MKKGLRSLLILALVLALTVGFATVAQAKNASRLTMSRRALSMDWATTYRLSVTLTPTNASDRGLITWTSSEEGLVSVVADPANPRKATVHVRARVGEEPYPTTPVIITATSKVTGRRATCLVTVKQVFVSSLVVSPAAKAVYLTASAPTYQLNVAPVPSVAGFDSASVVWTSGDSALATVDASGLVTFKKEGTVRISAAYTSGGRPVSASCRFTIKPVRVKSVTLACEGKSISRLYVDQGDHFTLTATVNSAVNGLTPSYPTVTWSTSNSSFATVDGGVVTTHDSGMATITATADGKSAAFDVYVRDTSPATVTITVGGDCVLGGDPRTTGITARSTQRNYEKIIAANSPTYPFEKIAGLFKDTGETGYKNLSIVNVEVTLTTGGGSNPSTGRKFLFRGRPANAAALGIGIDVANIANNHTTDLGSSPFGTTARSIASYGGGAKPSGYYRPTGANYVPHFTVGGKEVGFYGVIANQMAVSQVYSRVKKIKADYNLDMLVVSFHWAGQKEYKRNASSAMRSYARRAIDGGADLVVGHHRHVSGGIEKYKGKYIIYDLGNLVTGGGSSRYTYMAQVDFKISNGFVETASEGTVDQIRIYPMITSSDPLKLFDAKKKKFVGQDNNWQPVPGDEGIYSYNKVTDEKKMVTDATAQVRSIIESSSPNGYEGRFTTDGHWGDFSKLPS